VTSATIKFPGAAAAAADITKPRVPPIELTPFAAVCPKCKDVRFQRGYTPRSLFRLLGRNQPIEAYCVVCDAFWPISAKERRALVERLLSTRE
jgi:hypothetical protein